MALSSSCSLGDFVGGVDKNYSSSVSSRHSSWGTHRSQLFAILAIDLLWFNRNLAVHGKTFWDPLAFVTQVKKVSKEHADAWGRKEEIGRIPR